MSTATQGRRKEYQVRDAMALAGWLPVMRAAASKGPGDLLMVHPDHGGALIQVGSRSKVITPASRELLVSVSEWAGLLPILAVVVPRVGITYWHVTRAPAGRWPAWKP